MTQLNLSDYIFEQGLIIIPLLNIIGMIIKNIGFISDRYIPVILLVIGIASSMGLMGVSVSSAIQGVLLTGTAVFGNQLVKQLSPARNDGGQE